MSAATTHSSKKLARKIRNIAERRVLIVASPLPLLIFILSIDIFVV